MAVDITQIWINLSHSLEPVAKMLAGVSYLMGLGFVSSALKKYKSNYSGYHGHGGGYSSANVHLIVGSILIFLPSSLDTLSNTFFVTSNPLSYTKNPQNDWMAALGSLIQIIGLVFFLRGCAFLVESSDQQSQTSHNKGFIFIISGILAMNFTATVEEINKLTELITSTPMIKNLLHYFHNS